MLTLSTIRFSENPGVEHQQIGSVWSGSFLVSASLSGDLNYIDPRASSKPVRVVKGHQRGITALTVTPAKRIYSGSYDGKIYGWDLGNGSGKEIDGAGHSNQVVSLASKEEKIFSIGMDDSFRSFSSSTNAFE